MNKLNKLLALALISAPGLLFAQDQEFIIKGKVPTNSKILQVYFINAHKMDSAKVINGTFDYRCAVKTPISTILVRDKLGKGFKAAVSSESTVVFYEEPGKVSMELPDDGEFANVKGGKANQELKAYNELVADLYQQIADVISQLNTTKDAAEATALNKKMGEDFGKKILLTLQFGKEHPDSYVALDKAYLDTRMDIPAEMIKQCETVYNGFTDELKQSEVGIAFGKLLPLKMGTIIGGEALDFTAMDSLDHPVNLKSLRGKYVLLDFWASWCGPCRQENPNVLKAFEKYKNKNFTVLAVSLDKKPARDKWLKSIEHDHLTYPQVWDPDGNVANQYLIHAIPHNFLIDPNGKIVGTNLFGEDLQKKLAGLLNK